MKAIDRFAVGLFFIILAGSLSWADESLHGAGPTVPHEQKEAILPFSGTIEDNVRVVEVKASRYKFEPDTIVVGFGEKVRLVVTSLDVDHGLAIPDFKVNVTVVYGRTAVAEFVADKKGTFHAHCSVYCGPGHAHMHAVLIVQ